MANPEIDIVQMAQIKMATAAPHLCVWHEGVQDMRWLRFHHRKSADEQVADRDKRGSIAFYVYDPFGHYPPPWMSAKEYYGVTNFVTTNIGLCTECHEDVVPRDTSGCCVLCLPTANYQRGYRNGFNSGWDEGHAAGYAKAREEWVERRHHNFS